MLLLLLSFGIATGTCPRDPMEHGRDSGGDRLTGIGREKGAALAVDDFLDDGHVLRDGRGHHAQTRHHGVHGVHGHDASHHAQARVKICGRTYRERQCESKKGTASKRTKTAD